MESIYTYLENQDYIHIAFFLHQKTMTKYEVNLKSKDFYVYCVASFFSIFTSQMGPVSSAPLAASLQMTGGGQNVIHEIWHANYNFQKDRQKN